MENRGAGDSKNNGGHDFGKLERDLRRIKIITWLKIIVILIIIIGIISYLISIYLAASSLSVEEKNIKSIQSTGGFEEFEAILVLTIKNPTSTTIEVEKLTYDVYIDRSYVGDGEKGKFSIPPGVDDYEFEIIFDIRALPPIAKNLFIDGEADLTIKGDVTIPAKVFGLFTYTTITLPYSVTEKLEVGTGNDNGGAGAPEPVVLNEPLPAGRNAVRLSWSVSSEADFARYEVHMSTNSGFDPGAETLVTEIYDITTTTHVISDLDRFTTFYFKIVVKDLQNLSAVSNEVSYTNI